MTADLLPPPPPAAVGDFPDFSFFSIDADFRDILQDLRKSIFRLEMPALDNVNCIAEEGLLLFLLPLTTLLLFVPMTDLACDFMLLLERTEPADLNCFEMGVGLEDREDLVFDLTPPRDLQIWDFSVLSDFRDLMDFGDCKGKEKKGKPV